LLVLSCFVLLASAKLGVDVSEATYIDNFKCLKGKGFDFAVVRCFESTGHPDPNGPHTVYNAWDGGMAEVDVYMFPCPTCGDPAGQVTSAVNYLKSYNTKYGMFWLDIEGPQYWYSSKADNIKFFEGLVTQAKLMGQKVGVYSSASQWIPIFGGYTGGSGYPLWYAHYDNQPNFNDFQPFAGWRTPTIKQYNGDISTCGTGIDENYE